MADTARYWVGSREHLELSIQEGSIDTVDYQVALVRFPAMYTEADWKSNAQFAGKHGVWIEDTLTAGGYRVWARAGTGAPNERAIVFCGYVDIVNR